MNRDETLQVLKEVEAVLEGHFLLSSGKHSGTYCQCAKLMRFPDKAAQVLKSVVQQVEGLSITKVCGPAMGGINVSYEIARQLGKESIFTERKGGEMALRRGFSVGSGDRILITEDVVTTGKSTLETVRALEAYGARVIGVACIVDRHTPDCLLSIPVYSAVTLQIDAYDSEDCPICREGRIPLDKPGSREQNKGTALHFKEGSMKIVSSLR
ncbi:MAG: orotate phosphoribosyltransferase [Christensenellaceae bacterium]|jgi:orotate phosphoribosyltransferase|nr:orotate phosphoribosyltransferase [Christensenellaceae bacterium]